MDPRKQRMKALIAGAGIGGLAAGIALRRAGWEVKIFERSREMREIGAGLMIWPNGTRALQALGVEVRAMSIDRLFLRNWRGRQLMEAPVRAISERFGSNVAVVHRADLQSALVKSLGREVLSLGSEVSGFDDAAKVEVKLRDGTSDAGDLLIGADGLRSTVRRQLLADGDPVYLGASIWRGMVSSEGLSLKPGFGVNWIGRGSEFLAFHLADHRIYWAGVTIEPGGEKAGPGGHKQDALERFATWEKDIPALIAATEPTAILRNDMYDRPPSRRWSKGRVTLVGDAAHPMTPNQGQGACQALEDAVALGESLEGASDPARAFEIYEKRRIHRANRAVAMSRQASRGVHIENPVLCAIRDGLARALPHSLVVRMLDPVLAAER
jgi:2-polyprenyl-6-methoxyphenol hydroxylase-like FAD-dependent oxidoreductase